MSTIHHRRILSKVIGLGTTALVSGVIALGASVLHPSLDGTAAAAEPAAFSTWAKTARIAGAATWVDMTTAEINSVINKMIAQNVSVIEADSDLSMYLSDAEFQKEIDLMKRFADAAHGKNLKVVWYYPAFEVLTANAASTANTMYKDNPEWVQWGLDGTGNPAPNVFIGGQGSVFWVDPGMESAWMSPSSPYRDYFISRAQKIAKTGVDGLWIDVPIYAVDGPVQWSDMNTRYAAARYNAVTGRTVPTTENWSDPNWRRWISWRHEEIARFLKDVAIATRSAGGSNFAIFTETVTMDYNAATQVGLDGGSLKELEGITHVWEIDAVSDGSGSRQARPDDWICLIAMNKYARAASGSKPSWAFTYGKQANDAELVMAESLVAANNPYETKIPEMTKSVGAAYRTKMFGWTKQYTDQIFNSTSAAKVAVYYSEASRDFVDQAKGVGLYVTTKSGEWWSSDPIDSAKARPYVGEYRGVVKALVRSHMPFDVVVKPRDVNELLKYALVILPNTQAISESDSNILSQYVAQGGKLLATAQKPESPAPTSLNEYGEPRNPIPLSDVLPNGPGKEYLSTSSATAYNALTGAINRLSAPILTTDAKPMVHLELRQFGNQMIVQAVNATGVTGSFAVVPTSFKVNLTLEQNKLATSVALASPDNATMALTSTNFTQNGSVVSFTMPVNMYAMAIVTTN